MSFPMWRFRSICNEYEIQWAYFPPVSSAHMVLALGKFVQISFERELNLLWICLARAKRGSFLSLTDCYNAHLSEKWDFGS